MSKSAQETERRPEARFNVMTGSAFKADGPHAGELVRVLYRDCSAEFLAQVRAFEEAAARHGWR